MPTRRKVIQQVAAAGALAAGRICATPFAMASATDASPPSQAPRRRRTTPYSRIKGLIRREETLSRIDIGAGGFKLSWAADGSQFMSWADGVDLAKTKVCHCRVDVVSGDPPNPTFADLPGYPDMIAKMEGTDSAYWGSSCLALDGCVYQFLMTPSHDWLKPGGGLWPGYHAAGAKLIYSSDNGLTWRNQDGSTPVVWERWHDRSRKNMVFFEEQPVGAFASPVFLQMGQDYGLNKDGYAYVYSPNGLTDGTMNELVMFRVPKARILDRSAYEFFSGRRSDGRPQWTKDIASRRVVHTFPRGWVNRMIPGMSPYSWTPDVTYNEPLGVYLLTSFGNGVSPTGERFAKPSYLGFWIAPDPWGPFTQIHEELAWTPGNDADSRAIGPTIPPKWISADGKTFWLAWSDYGYKTEAGVKKNPDKSFVEEVKPMADTAEFARVFFEWSEKYMRNGDCFNIQRIDVVTG
jgi:hypothetical protein